jgi:zinc protease
MRPVFDEAPLEFSVVGDFDVDGAIALASAYFGSLPPRMEAPENGRSDRIAFPRGRTLEVPVQTQSDKGVVQVAYPTDDIWDIGKTRRLSVLSTIFSDRMREIIREKLGASYSQEAYNAASRAYPGYGVMSAVIRISPEDAGTVIREVKRIAREIVRDGISADELKRALDPTLTSIKDLQQKNRYWLNTVLSGSREHPEQLEWSRSIARDYGSITIAELRRLARRYLDNDAAAVIIVRPAVGVADRPTAHPAG